MVALGKKERYLLNFGTDGVAVDGEQCLLDDLADGAQIARGGGDEDLGRVHDGSGGVVPKGYSAGAGGMTFWIITPSLPGFAVSFRISFPRWISWGIGIEGMGVVILILRP